MFGGESGKDFVHKWNSRCWLHALAYLGSFSKGAWAFTKNLTTPDRKLRPNLLPFDPLANWLPNILGWATILGWTPPIMMSSYVYISSRLTSSNQSWIIEGRKGTTYIIMMLIKKTTNSLASEEELYLSCMAAAAKVLVWVISSPQSLTLYTPTFTTMSWLAVLTFFCCIQWAAEKISKVISRKNVIIK